MKQAQILRSRLEEAIPFCQEEIPNEDSLCNDNNKTEARKLQKLNTLTICHIYFQKIQPNIRDLMEDKLNKIEELKIINCDLRTLQNFPLLSRLTDLNLSKNSLQGSFQFLVKNRTIHYLDISDNIVKDIKKLEPLRRLKRISIYANNNPFYNTRNLGKGSTTTIASKESLANKLKSLGITLLKEQKKSRMTVDENKSNCQINKKENNAKSKTLGEKSLNKLKKSASNPFSVRNTQMLEEQGVGGRINSIRELLRESRQELISDNNYRIELGMRHRSSLSHTSSIDDLRFLTQKSHDLLRLRQRSRELEGSLYNSERGRSRTLSNLMREGSGDRQLLSQMANMHRRVIHIEDDVDDEDHHVILSQSQSIDQSLLSRDRTQNAHIMERINLRESGASNSVRNHESRRRQTQNNLNSLRNLSNDNSQLIQNNLNNSSVRNPQNNNPHQEIVEEVNLINIGSQANNQQSGNNDESEQNNRVREAQQGWGSEELEEVDLDEELEEFDLNQQLSQSSENQLIMGILEMNSNNRSSSNEDLDNLENQIIEELNRMQGDGEVQIGQENSSSSSHINP